MSISLSEYVKIKMNDGALIGILNKDKTVDYIFIDHNGHLSGVGLQLLEKFKNEKLVRELIDYGDCSTLMDHLTPFKSSSHHISSVENFKLIKNVENFYLFVENSWFYISLLTKKIGNNFPFHAENSWKEDNDWKIVK